MRVFIFFTLVYSLCSSEVLTYSPGLLKLLHPKLKNWHFQAGRFMKNQDLLSLRLELGRLDTLCLKLEEEIREIRQAQRTEVLPGSPMSQNRYKEINQALRLDLKANQEQCRKQKNEITQKYFFNAEQSGLMLKKIEEEIELTVKRLIDPKATLIRQPEQVEGLKVSHSDIDLSHLSDPFHPLESFLSQDFERLDRIQALHNINLPADEATDKATLDAMKQYVDRFLVLNVFPAIMTEARDISSEAIVSLAREWKLSSAQVQSLELFVREYLKEAIR
ncbi:MAG: hypothetical protein H3C47_01210 [Candidatus Cloacimonetes bacterium]|nr:hypothetical protein [Candidatus Cloacimonadota bacterium]